MTDITTSDFFGLHIEPNRADPLYVLGLVPELLKAVNNSNVVKSLIKQHTSKHPIVTVARRQQALKTVKALLNDKLMEYDSVFYEKDVNTASDSDRKYGAEEKLLTVSLMLATGKSCEAILRDDFQPSLKVIRNAAFKGSRFDRLWELLTENTEHTVKMFRAKKVETKSDGFLSKLFK